MPQEISKQPIDDMVDVVTSCAQIGIVHFIEHGDQAIALQFQRPFRVAVLLADAA